MTTETTPATRSPTPAAHSMFAPLQREFDRMLDDFNRVLDPNAPARLSPRMNLSETDAEIELTVELPGLDKDGVKIDVVGDRLTISGEKRSERDDKGRDWRLTERSHGAFSRSIELPGIDASKIEAVMDNGVLKITAPKTPKVQPRPIEIRSS
jgi:HSP20 family protein